MKMFDKLVWKKEYTVVLVLNIAYVLIFYYVMTAYS
jgi:hypothetical protein